MSYSGKAVLTNLVALGAVGISFLLPEPVSAFMLMGGLFALSGAVTNWLAIRMLFHKVPFLYGSGVIEERFEEVKRGIHGLMMNQFFTKENLERFFSENSDEKPIDLAPVLEETDLSPAFDSLKGAVLESSFGTMLGMFGGANALDGLKGPFESRMKGALIKIAHSAGFQKTLQQNLHNGRLSHDILVKIDRIVVQRLDELTPLMVREIMEKMIREHLGWLIVWGGVFGALFGVLGAAIL